jgi:hypothetical protein
LAYELISLLARSLLTIFQLFYGFLNYNYMWQPIITFVVDYVNTPDRNVMYN